VIPAPDLLLFFGLVFGIVILPGLDMAFILGSALVGGRATGFAAIAGIVTGGFFHVSIGGLGIAIVLKLFPAAFSALLLAGAAYMAWIGISLWKSGASLGAPEGAILPSRAATFRRGALTNILNPKAYAFMLSIFPQFVRPDHGPIATQALQLGTIITATQLGVYGAIVCAADRARGWLGLHPTVQRNLAKSIGLLLVACALWSAVEGVRHFTSGR
jgi:threonine/homoserine/homoserine lactone efflux protein